MAKRNDLRLDDEMVKTHYGVLLRDAVVIWPEDSHDGDHSDRWSRTYGNHWWPDQRWAAARCRPIAERVWGRVLDEAGARHAGEDLSRRPD